MTKRTVLLGLAGVAGAMVLSRQLGSRPEAAYGDGPLAPCPSDPNCALVRVRLAAPTERVEAAALAVVRTHQTWRTGRATSVTPTASGVEATFTVGPFVDRFALTVEPDDAGGSVLWIRSAAQQGRSDLGVNRARVRGIVDRIRTELG